MSASATARPRSPVQRRGSSRNLSRFLPVVFPIVLGLTALALVCGRFIWQARQCVQAAQIAARTGDGAEATRLYLDALRAYVPGSPYQSHALDGLENLAAAAHAAGDPHGERRAWDAMRAGLLASRSLYLPYAARFAKANRRLSELAASAAFPPQGAVAPEIVHASRRGNGPGRSVRPSGPAVAATLISLVGFTIWVGSAVLLIRRGIPKMAREGGTRLARLLLPVMIVVGFALFLVGMRFS